VSLCESWTPSEVCFFASAFAFLSVCLSLSEADSFDFSLGEMRDKFDIFFSDTSSSSFLVANRVIQEACAFVIQCEW